MISIKSNIDKIKRFEFYFGNPFCGIRKVNIFFGEEYRVMSNALNKKNPPRQGKLIKELKTIDFDNWKEEYSIPNPNSDNAWTINLTFEGELITFRGIDCYPHDWFKILDFLDNIGKFDIEEMMMDGEYDE